MKWVRAWYKKSEIEQGMKSNDALHVQGTMAGGWGVKKEDVEGVWKGEDNLMTALSPIIIKNGQIIASLWIPKVF